MTTDPEHWVTKRWAGAGRDVNGDPFRIGAFNACNSDKTFPEGLRRSRC